MRLWKKYKMYLINSLVIIGLFLLVLVINHVSPFGNNILGKSDAISEFKPMLFNFITKLRDGSLLNYSFNNGLGNPFVFDYIYHLTSPLNFIALLFKSADGMFLSTIILKLLVGSIIMTYYVKTKTNNNYIVFIATLSYIFSSWMVTYYYYLPWLDVFILLPLLQVGMDNLFEKNKPTIYLISLALITICNFYLAFTIYIYVIFYFIIHELFYKKTSFKEKLLSFDKTVLYTLLSFCFIFIYLYVLFDVYKKTGMSIDSSTSNHYIISFGDFIKSLLYGNSVLTIEMSGNTFPNIACNHFVLINCLYFFLNNKIKIKDKIYVGIVIVIVLCTIFVKPFDFVLNFFHHIRGLTFRYSYIFIFLSIMLFIYNINNTDKVNKKRLLIVIGFILLLIIFSYKNMSLSILLFNIVSIVLYSVVILISNDKWIFKLLICILVVGQSFFVGYKYIAVNQLMEEQNYDEYTKENAQYRLNISENYKSEVFNHNLYLNSKVTHLLSAMNYNSTLKLANSLGCNVFSNSSMYCQNTNQIRNMLFNVKGDYYLEKLFNVNNDIVNYIETNNVDYNTKEIIELMTGLDNNNIDEIYDYLSKNQIEYTYYNDNHIEGNIHVDKNQIIYTSIPYDDSWEVKVDGEKVKQIMILDSLIGIEVNEGDHFIEMRYKCNDYIVPFVISISSVITYVIVRIIKRKKAVSI